MKPVSGMQWAKDFGVHQIYQTKPFSSLTQEDSMDYTSPNEPIFVI